MHASLSVCCLPIHTLKFGAFASASPNVHRFVRSFVIPLLMALVGMAVQVQMFATLRGAAFPLVLIKEIIGVMLIVGM